MQFSQLDKRSGGEVGRAQENFSFEHLGSMVRILLEVVFSYIIIYIFYRLLFHSWAAVNKCISLHKYWVSVAVLT